MNYHEFMHAYPVLGKRLHTLHCESCRPGGISEKIVYEGDQYDGIGRVTVFLQYGSKTFPFRVTNGTIYAFGRQQSMYRPTVMVLSGGRRSTYDNEPILPKRN
jgi:hypothetical protein